MIQGFREISVKTAELQLDDEAIEGILRDLTGQLEFDFAVISMVDEYQERIRHERGRNVPRGWRRRASFLLSDPKALLPDLVRSGRTEVIEGWDDRFDREIYDRFGHKDLIRVWAPIKRGTKVLGILQAGRHTRRGKLTPAVVARVEEYAENSFEVISRSRPIVLLELISRHAQNIVGAHGASVHVFNVGGQLEAGYGEISKEFVIAAGKDLKGVLAEDPEPSHWLFSLIAAKGHGLCSTAAFRLNLDHDQAGVLCVHFTSQHDFSPGEVDLLRSFAGLVSVSLLDNHLLTKLSSTTELAWTVSSLQRILEALSSTAPLNDLLQELTDRMLAMFDADCVVLHQFDEARQDFSPSPVMSGRFNAPDVVKRPLTRDALPWKIMATGTVFAGPVEVAPCRT